MRVFYVVIPQPDGTILVGGRPGLKRLLAKGTEDLSFTSAVSELIFSLSQQTDGRMIIGGGFTTVEGRNYLARVNPDGSLDTIFHPVPSDTVLSVMHQKDGGIVVGGYFGGMQDTLRSNIARIHNTPAYQTLTFANPNRVEWLRAGSAPETSRVIFELSTNGGSMHVSRERLRGMLNLPGASVKRKIRQRAMLSQEQSERVLGLLRLIGQVAVMVEHSGDPKEFDAARWVGDWIERPIPALGGSRPADYMETLVGQTIVSQLLAQSQAAVFA